MNGNNKNGIQVVDGVPGSPTKSPAQNPFSPRQRVSRAATKQQVNDMTNFARRAHQSRSENSNNNPASLFENKPQTGHNMNLLNQRYQSGGPLDHEGEKHDDGVPIIPMREKKDKNSYYAAAQVRRSQGAPALPGSGSG